MRSADIEPFFATLKAANPDPASELEYTSVFELLAAVLLEQDAAGLEQHPCLVAVEADRADRLGQPF